MKKALPIIIAVVAVIAIILCVVLFASGDNENAMSNTAPEATIGDTVKTDMVELQLTKVVYDYKYPYPYTIPAPAGKVFIQVNFNIKNIGKTTIEGLPTRAGKNYYTLASVWLNYNDGYIFDIKDITDGNGDSVAAGFLFNEIYDFPLEPLSPALDCHPVFCVPTEVLENKSAPLLFSINLPSSDGTYITMTFKLR